MHRDEQRRVRLEPLHCPSCGGWVPLGDAESARCSYCQSELAIPADYLGLRAADRAHAAGRRRAEQLYVRIGQPPSRALRFWARAGTFVLWGTLAVAPVSLLLWLVVISEAWHLAPYVGFQPVDVVGGVPLSLLLGVFLFLVVVRPVLLVANARRLARARQMLQAALAARPPERPGGPATCRNCGAPLDVPASALGVRCLYCREHNLVAIPENWIARARTASKLLVVHLSEASAEERMQRRHVQRRSRRVLVSSAVILLLLSLAASALSSGPSYREYASASVPALYSKNMYNPELIHGKAVQLSFEACRSECCGIDYMAALERGQTSRFISDAEEMPSVTYRPSYVDGPVYPAPFLASESVFRAPWSGWFDVRLEFPGSCSRPRRWPVRWERDPAR
ncbi:MAG TPA: hypothetical protein VK524_17430 [Polyangiaceae bacterium]|nr:hypothetical protein [Polyangiaceae bacterium]